MSKRVVIYSRSVSVSQSGSAIADQERLCTTYAAQQGWVEAARYSDAGCSGRAATRPGLLQMLAAADRGEFDVLLVESIERVSREPAEVLRIAKDFEALGIALCTAVKGVQKDDLAIARWIFSDFNADRTIREICADLNADVVPVPERGQ